MDKNLRCNYRKKTSHHNKDSNKVLKTTLKSVIQKAVEATEDLVGNEITAKITNAASSKCSSKSTERLQIDQKSMQGAQEHNISSYKQQQIIDELRFYRK